MEEKKYSPLKILFSVLLFGGAWGIVEATLGSFLHLPFVKAAGIFVSNSAILVPIAFAFMAACYKRTNVFRSVAYMGLLAGFIKAIVCLVFKLDITPVYYIVLEALCMAGALAAVRPNKIISFTGLGTFILASTSYFLFGMFVRFRATGFTAADTLAYVEKYVLMCNALAILYTFALGAIIFGFIKLSEKQQWSFEGLKKVVYSPITAAVVAVIMVTVTFLIR